MDNYFYQSLSIQVSWGNNKIVEKTVGFFAQAACQRDWFNAENKYKKTFNRQFLTADELSIIEKKEFKISRIEQAKDIFVFSCYTGLAYIDVFNLRQNNIVRGIDGDYWLYTNRKKRMFRSIFHCYQNHWQSLKNIKTIQEFRHRINWYPPTPTKN